jgi:hypothetical protein
LLTVSPLATAFEVVTLTVPLRLALLAGAVIAVVGEGLVSKSCPDSCIAG